MANLNATAEPTEASRNTRPLTLKRPFHSLVRAETHQRRILKGCRGMIGREDKQGAFLRLCFSVEKKKNPSFVLRSALESETPFRLLPVVRYSWRIYILQEMLSAQTLLDFWTLTPANMISGFAFLPFSF